MSSRHEPQRLSELADDSVQLSTAIRALRSERASVAQVEALASRLATQLTTPTTAGTQIGPAVPWIKWLSGITLSLAAIAYVSGRVVRDAASPQRQPAVIAAAPSTPTTAPRIVAPETAPQPAPTPELIPAQPVRARIGTRIEPKPRVVEPEPATPTAELELALLERSRAALGTDPTTALSLAEQHAHAYPHGVFAQEREVLAIEALLKLKHKPAARERAERFIASFPDSSHAPHVRALIAQIPSAAADVHASSPPAPEP